MVANYRDLPVSPRSIGFQHIIDLPAIEKSRYFAQPRVIIVKYWSLKKQTKNKQATKHKSYIELMRKRPDSAISRIKAARNFFML